MSERIRARRASPGGGLKRRRRAAYGQVSGPRPDRVAAWAVALGIFLILVASATSRGATTGGAGPPASGDGGSTADPTVPHEAARGQSLDRALIARMQVRLATWYGPGFYGHRTACGVKLHRSTEGVAHRTLPCGTRVSFYRRGRFKTVPVIDRGPFARGVSWDLTAATARSLGLERTGPIRSITLPQGR